MESPYLVWVVCPPKNTRDELRDIEDMIPPGIQFRSFRSRGEERVEFEPTPLRPRGAIIKVKSYGMPREEFQRDAVHRIRFDEECPEGIWSECEQRLISTKGTLILTLTPINGTTWLWKKLRELKAEFYAQKSGDFSWFRFLVKDNPGVDFEEVKLRSQGLSEDEYAIRVEGQYILMSGSQFFSAEFLKKQWDLYSRNPIHEMVIDANGDATFLGWKEKRRGWSVWEKPTYGVSYAIGADVGRGKGGDYSVAVILNCSSGAIAAMFSDNEIEPWEYGIEVMAAGRTYNDAVIAPEVNIEEGSMLHPLRQYGYPRIYRRKSYGGRIRDIQNTLGWYTDSKSKGSALEELRAAIKKGALEEPGGVMVYDAKTLDELGDFGHLKEKRPGAYGLGALTGHDDRVMALAIAWQAAKQAPASLVRSRHQFERSIIEQMEERAIAETLRQRAEAEADY